MAIESLSVLVDGQAGKDFLAERYAGVIENVQARTISSIFKNNELSGDPETGTVKAKRFANAQSQEYGTARTSGKGKQLKNKGVSIDIDTDREIIEEIEQKDISLLGVEGLVIRRSQNHISSMARELDTAFFKVAASGGTQFTTTKTTAKEKLDAIVLALHTTKNDYVDGVDKEFIHVVLSPEAYSDVRDYIDEKQNANVDTSIEEFGRYHGVWVYSNIHQPKGVEMIAMCTGAVAQPVLPRPYAANKLPQSEAISIELFFYYGTKAVMPDLIQVLGVPLGRSGFTTHTVVVPEDDNGTDLNKMTKNQIVEFAETERYEIDDKLNKAEMIAQLELQMATADL